MIVVSDTSPICYLILIKAIDLLPQIYGQVIIPQAVYTELSSSAAPCEVRHWLQEQPAWLTIQKISTDPDIALKRLDPGEYEAILLAESIRADAVLIDEKAARNTAIERGLNVVGLLGVLGTGASLGLINFRQAIERLQQTNFWLSPRLIQKLLNLYDDRE
jgi:predicted nucleic acid-binding protein